MPFLPHLTHCNLFSAVFNVLHVPAYSQCVSNILSAICLACTPYICANRCVRRFCLVLRDADCFSCSCSRFSIYLSVVHMYTCMCVHPYPSFFHVSGHNLALPPGEDGTFQSLCGFLMVSDVSAGIFKPFSALYV